MFLLNLRRVPSLKTGLILVAIIVLAILTLRLITQQYLSSPLTLSDNSAVIVVPAGTGLNALANKMARNGFIKWPKMFASIANFQGKNKIIAGEFAVSKGTTVAELMDILVSGKVVQHKVTFPEGTSFADWLMLLKKQPELEQKYPSSNQQLLSSLGIDVDHPEGWFFPDTYQFTRGDNYAAILVRAHQKMRVILEREWLKRDNNLPYTSPYEALIMASIVEKETGQARERAKIAGVFVRRLKMGMKLQTDPTVVYGMGDRYNGNITRKDLQQPTPYNTYTIPGLPPTPIAMPGLAAIQAALHPEPGDSLFFVAKGDGSHYFSATLEEHNAAVKKYQLQRRSDYRSSP